MSSEHPRASDLVLGIKPWFPWPLSRCRWLTVPIRAERLAVFRIGLALLMLMDVLFTLIPNVPHFFDPEGIWSPGVYPWHFWKGQLRWTLLEKATSRHVVAALMWLWAGSLVFLLLGLFTRASAIVAWILAVSVANVMYHVQNAGDNLKLLWLFYLMVCPSGAAWSLDSWWRRRYSWQWHGVVCTPRRREVVDERPCFVHPWPMRLMVIQLCVMYFFNGLYKANGNDWRSGQALYYALGDLALTRFSFAQISIPWWILKVTTWLVMFWEMLFPFVMLVPWRLLADCMQSSGWKVIRGSQGLVRWNREIFLCFGVAFHLGIALLMEIGFFSFYVLCAYLPMLPWEKSRWARAK